MIFVPVFNEVAHVENILTGRTHNYFDTPGVFFQPMSPILALTITGKCSSPSKCAFTSFEFRSVIYFSILGFGVRTTGRSQEASMAFSEASRSSRAW